MFRPCDGYRLISSPAMREADLEIGHSLEPANQSLCARLGCKSVLGGALVDRSGRREIVTATATALVLGVLVSWGTVYGLNRYLGPSADPYEITGSVRAPHPFD